MRINMLSWLRANQSALSSKCCVLNLVATNARFLSLVWPDQGSNPRSTTLEMNMLTITPLIRLCSNEVIDVVDVFKPYYLIFILTNYDIYVCYFFNMERDFSNTFDEQHMNSWDVLYDFRTIPMLASFLFPVVCGRAHILFTLFLFMFV
jgi:hypothetical protein